MATHAERRKATRSSIISAARECFVAQGFEGTHTDTIVERAGVSRGAMYHHFPSKRDVFEAVYVALVEETITQARNTLVDSDSPLEALFAACMAWLAAVRKPAIAKILLDQGPQVLGWTRAREIEAQISLPLMRRGLERAQQANEIEVHSVEIAALLINALLAEAALLSAYGKPKPSEDIIETSIRKFIDGLRT
ncbi:MAG: TetR/AcrR family transcriptional regulator [Pseudomonadota bacterium]